VVFVKPPWRANASSGSLSVCDFIKEKLIAGFKQKFAAGQMPVWRGSRLFPQNIVAGPEMTLANVRE